MTEAAQVAWLILQSLLTAFASGAHAIPPVCN